MVLCYQPVTPRKKLLLRQCSPVGKAGVLKSDRPGLKISFATCLWYDLGPSLNLSGSQLFCLEHGGEISTVGCRAQQIYVHILALCLLVTSPTWILVCSLVKWGKMQQGRHIAGPLKGGRILVQRLLSVSQGKVIPFHQHFWVRTCDSSSWGFNFFICGTQPVVPISRPVKNENCRWKGSVL